MADLLRITTPLVDRVPTQGTQSGARSVVDPAVPFDLSDVTRVIQTNNAAEIMQQNTGLMAGEAETPKILIDLLQDPAVTSSMIRSISVLEEIISLLPANNASLTREIEQLFSSLLLSPDQIVAELQKQEHSTTLFRGDLFDQLRMILAQSQNKPEVATGIGVFLKALNASLSRNDVLESVSNNLAFLASNLRSSPTLSEKLNGLIAALRAPNAGESFPQLKAQVMEMMRTVQSSVLYTPEMEKTMPLIIYNLSRYNDNQDFLPDALNLLLYTMNNEGQKNLLVDNLQRFIEKLFPESTALETAQSQSLTPQEATVLRQNLIKDLFLLNGPGVSVAAHVARAVEEESQVMESLAKIIGKQARSEDISLLSGDKVEKIIHSLLSSPSNFTPLLHFIVPVEHNNLRAFAEIWVDPNADSDSPAKKKGGEDATHMLMVFDVEGIGRFESELYVQDKRLALNLLCPPPYLEFFKDVGPALRKAIAKTGYSFEAIHIDRMERTHSLMEVFTNLPHKRTGIDVTI